MKGKKFVFVRNDFLILRIHEYFELYKSYELFGIIRQRNILELCLQLYNVCCN